MKLLIVLYGLVFAASVFLPPSDRFGYFMGVVATSLIFVVEELRSEK